MKRNYWLDRGDGKGPMHDKYFEDFHIAGQLAYDVGATLRTGPDKVSFMQLMGEAKRMQASNAHLRYGQCMSGALAYLAPDIADRVRGTDADPFYDDTRINNMIQCFFAERG